MKASIKTIRIHRYGGPEVLTVETVDLPQPLPGQALVRHEAIGVNFIDTYHRSGLYPLPAFPHGIGLEAAGVVEAIDDPSGDLRIGDRVAYAAGPPGAYAEARCVPIERLVPLPREISSPLAAAVMLKGMTVEYLIRRTFTVQPGQTVLVHAAAGGVGLIACQWLKALGATVIGTVGNEEKAELARTHGCDHPIVYTKESFVDRVKAITDGAGVPVVYDSVGRDTCMGSLACLSRRGTLVLFGNASGPPPAVDPLELSRGGSLFLTRPVLFDYVATRAELLASARALFEVIQSGEVKVEVAQTHGLTDARLAHEALEGRKTRGSTILVP